MQVSLRTILVWIVFISISFALIASQLQVDALKRKSIELQIELQHEKNRLGHLHIEYETLGECLVNTAEYCVLAITVRTYVPHVMRITLDSKQYYEHSEYYLSERMHMSRVIVSGQKESESVTRITVGSLRFNQSVAEKYDKSTDLSQIFSGWGSSGAVTGENISEEAIRLFEWQQDHTLNISFSLK